MQKKQKNTRMSLNKEKVMNLTNVGMSAAQMENVLGKGQARIFDRPLVEIPRATNEANTFTIAGGFELPK